MYAKHAKEIAQFLNSNKDSWTMVADDDGYPVFTIDRNSAIANIIKRLTRRASNDQPFGCVIQYTNQ